MDAIQQNSLFTETRCEPLISASTLALKMFWSEQLMLMILPPCSLVRGPWKKGTLWETHSQLCRAGRRTTDQVPFFPCLITVHCSVLSFLWPVLPAAWCPPGSLQGPVTLHPGLCWPSEDWRCCFPSHCQHHLTTPASNCFPAHVSEPAPLNSRSFSRPHRCSGEPLGSSRENSEGD